MNKDIKLLIENIFQREGARELLKRSKAEEIDAQIRKMYLYHPTTKDELIDNIIECLENKTDLNFIDVSEIDDFGSLFNKINIYIQKHDITSIDISGWYMRSDANLKQMFKYFTIKEIVLPNNLQKIDDDMFYESRLTSVTIPNSVKIIGDNAFRFCSSLKSVTIANSVISIGTDAFGNCRGLTSVTIPNSVASIGSCAFENCSSMKSVTIGNSVTSIEYKAFDGCSDLTDVYISDLAKWCAITFGSYDANPLYRAQHLYLNDSEVNDLTIPNSVTSIGKLAFVGCYKLTSVTIGDSVETIGEMAFHGCRGLTSVTIPESVTSIGYNAFRGCSRLTSVTILSKEISINYGAFRGCSGLTSMTIPNSVTKIGENAFYECPNLTIYVNNVDEFESKFENFNRSSIPIKSIKEKPINENIFQRKNARELLKRNKAEEIDAQIRKMYLYHPKTEYELEHIIIECLKNETDLNWIDVSEIDDFEELFNQYRIIGRYIEIHKITSIDISGWYIRSDANLENMFETSTLEEIVLPNNLQKIDIDMFNSSNLTSVTIPNSVTSINRFAFANCRRLTSVLIPDSVKEIGFAPFFRCPKLTIYVNNVAKFIRKFENFNRSIIPIKSIKEKPINENIFQREGARELLKRSKAEELDAQIRKMYLYHPTDFFELENNIIECLENKTDLNLIDVSEITIFDNLFRGWRISDYMKNNNNINKIDISGWYIRSDATTKKMFQYTKFTEVKLPNTISKIDSAMFSDSSIVSITIPDSVSMICSDAFSDCETLKEVFIGNNVSVISRSAFENCAIEELVIPDSVQSIRASAFANCENLTTVTMSSLVEEMENPFDGCDNLQTIYVDDVEKFKRKFSRILPNNVKIKPITEKPLL